MVLFLFHKFCYVNYHMNIRAEILLRWQLLRVWTLVFFMKKLFAFCCIVVEILSNNGIFDKVLLLLVGKIGIVMRSFSDLGINEVI